MNILNNIWNNYRAIIIQNCTDEFVATTSLTYWQNQLFASLVIYLLPLSTIAVIPGIYMAYVSNLLGLIVVDFIAIGTILSVAFVPHLSVFRRKLIFNGVLYVTSTTLLLYLGSFGPGLLYLLGLTIFVVLSLDKKYGYATLALNTFICIGIGFFIYFGWGNFLILNEYALDTWIAVSTNLIFLSGVSVFLIPVLLNGLQSALIQENKLRSEIETKQAELQNTIEQLHSKNKELEEFAYTISHDLKEPLRMIRSFMELLDKKYGPQLDEKAKKYIHFAVDGAERMTSSIDELLEYSRIGRLYKDFDEVNSEDILQEVLKTLSAEIEEKEAEISFSKLPVVKAVPVSLKILMQNLLSNSLKYQPEEQRPQISIQAKELESCWEFCVTDNGIGIEETYSDEIFNLFRRLHPKEKYSGTGMGLAISKKIVEQHNGTIWVTSENDKGCTFHFTILK